MMSIEKIVNASLKFLEKRIMSAALTITKPIEKLSGTLDKQADAQSRALSKLGAQFEAATKRMEKPTFDVNVDMKPLLAELSGIAKGMERVVAKKGPDLSVAEGYLKLILSAIQENSPKDFPIDAMDAVFGKLKPKDSVKFDDKQMQGLMAALTNGRGSINTSAMAKSATNWEVETVAITAADTEYEYIFPANTVSWTLKLRGTTGKLYYASATGKLPVSGDNSAYITVPANGTRSQDTVEYGGKKMYFESNIAGQIVELDVFTM